ncbi:TRAP transporter small permease [Cloacibacillus evryensis]|uniref:TRAP transporter small permease n=1 Tax=Cloacibacillus evryensis TaxID=508460 RepID=UPI000240E14A|nr:TRAP transporter small permease subunit [Cloacibacillus evryensis]EHL64136.1 hypothetical protein HMPREF1006_00963 [Synergistes sp. 3_1_syn1]
MTILESISQKTSKILRVILTIDITLIAVLAFAQVIFRYILNWPGHFIDELISLCAVWLYFMGSVNASVEEKHINARMLEIFTDNVKVIAGIRLFAALASFLIAAWLTYWGYDYLLYSVRKWKTSVVLGYPLILYESAVFICFLPMTFFAFVEICKYFKIYKNNKSNGVEI